MFNSNNCGSGIVPVMNMNGMMNNGYNNGMWGDGAWWIWILWFAMWGWGGNGMWGNGMNGGNGTQFMEAAVQRGFDNQTVINKLDGINNGICGLGYDQLAQMNGINNTIQQTGWNLQQTMQQNAIASMQQAWAAQQQASDCCCENRVGQMNIVNQMDRNNCATNTLIQQVSQQNQWNLSQGFRDLSDQVNAGFQRLETQQLMRENADLRQQLSECNLKETVMAGANYTINQVSPRSQPSYLTCNPNTGNVFPQSGLDQMAYQQWLRDRNNCCCNQNQCCNNGCGGF